MLIIYRILINLVLILSPIIILIRLIKKKEDYIRFKEKIGFFSKKRISGNLIWFHGASVGEIKSILPLIEKFEKNKKIKQILITTNTLSSSKLIKTFKYKKVIHQFFPIDTNFLSNKFISYWNPSKVFFIDSEIWPNTIINISNKNIPLILINGRITKKTFIKWMKIRNFSKELFSKFDLCLSSSKESANYLKRLNAKNIKYLGNIKYSNSEQDKQTVNKNLRKFFKKKNIWCASSTHETEEILCANTHTNLKRKINNLLTIIIPRHVERCEKIRSDLNKLDLKVHMHTSAKKIEKKTDIYLVNTYGITQSFFNECKNVFLGGSLVNHGGQNPIEAARYGCNILHGPNIDNFKEIYNFLKKKGVSHKINNSKDLTKFLSIKLITHSRSNKIEKKINTIGNIVLKKTYKVINSYK